MFKQFPKFYSDHFPIAAASIPVFVSRLSNVPYHLTQLLDLSADVRVSILPPLLCHGALLGPPVIVLPLLRDHHTGPGVVTEGVVFLVLLVLIGPLLPVLL